MNYKDSCRTCLSKCKDMRHVHSTIKIGGEDVRLSDILFNFYSYQVPDELEEPENLCVNCVHQLTLTHSFKLLIETSVKKLSENTSILEFSDNVDYDNDYSTDPEYKPDMSNAIEEYDQKPLSSYKVRPIQPKLEDGRSRVRKLLVRRQVNSNKLYCVECKATFMSKKHLMEHCKNNHPVKSTSGRDCQYCQEKFEEYKDLVVHHKLHLKPFLCLTCWDGFYKEDEFNTHKCQPGLSRRSKTDEKTLCQCDQCGKSYPPGYIKVHMMTHGNELKYCCKYCPKKFKVANSLNSHVLWNHKRTRSHKCDACGAMFITASAKSTHIRKNHLKEKKYSCESCTKRFFSKSELQRHMLTHTGVKNFHCHICEKSYQTRYGLNVHLKSHTQINVDMLGIN